MDSQTQSWAGVPIFTIGHSTHPLDELVSRLRSLQVSILVDIRTIPRSRHNPQFNGDALRSALKKRGLRYVHLPRLGGLRRARADSPNTGWRNASFRGFADYMLTAEFEAGLAELRALAAEGVVAIMCAEAVPWRCHRSLVADALQARGARVEHIVGLSRASQHRRTPFAVVRDLRVVYPGEPESDERLSAVGPLHLEATARVLQRLPSNRVDLWEEDEYRRALSTPEGLALARVSNRGSFEEPELRLEVMPRRLSAAVRADVAGAVRRILGLEVDPAPLQPLARAALGPAAAALRGMRPPRFPGLFEAFANVVPFQQVSLESGLAIVGRLVERFGPRLELDGRRYLAFPEAPVVAEAPASALKACGMSARKAEVLRGLAGKVASGELTEERLAASGTEDALAFLEELPGIGPWSAGLVLLRGLGRLDVFPPGDAAATRALAEQIRPGMTLEAIVARAGGRAPRLCCISAGSPAFPASAASDSRACAWGLFRSS